MPGKITKAPRLKVKRFSVLHSSFTAANTTETITVWAVPPAAQITGVVVRCKAKPDDSDGDLTAWCLEFGTSSGPDVDAFLTSHDYIAAAADSIESTCGVALTTQQGMYSATASTNFTCTATIVGENLDDVNINAGDWEVYVTYVQHTHS